MWRANDCCQSLLFIQSDNKIYNDTHFYATCMIRSRLIFPKVMKKVTRSNVRIILWEMEKSDVEDLSALSNVSRICVTLFLIKKSD